MVSAVLSLKEVLAEKLHEYCRSRLTQRQRFYKGVIS